MLNHSIGTLKGVGPKKYEEFSKLGIKTLEDLLYYFPRSYQDRGQTKLLNECRDQEKAGIIVKIIGKAHGTKIKGRKLHITKVPIKDMNDTRGELVWFNNFYIKNMLMVGRIYYVYGKVKRGYNMIQIESPDIKLVEDKNFKGEGIVPIYKLTTRISQKELRKFVKQTLQRVHGEVFDYLPKILRKKYKLCEINFALENIHYPEDMAHYKLAKKRLIFDEFFMIHLALREIKNNCKQGEGILLNKHQEEVQDLIEALPFVLTKAQKKALQDMMYDFQSGSKMNRLLQGDVGSGKTIIAIIALYYTCLNGYQSAMMAPTEILAIQHYEEVKKILADYNLRIELLTKSIDAKEKADIVERVKKGEVDILIGTHSIIQENIKFKNLAMVITDEQHRFGVRQRSALNRKGSNPHVLVMTATPIPRTLSSILYGDLDISILDELPPGRKKVKTYHITSDMEHKLYCFIKQQIRSGKQAYIVCPLVEESENIDANSVIEQADHLVDRYFNQEKVAIIHGKMKGYEKERIMGEFKNGSIDILISTSLIEVGVNVPNANIMVIQNAERFGLAQLHQLRGRVGRGDSQSFCFLLSDHPSATNKLRIQTMVNSNDGFAISEKDLMIRGPGEILGVLQHGLPEFKIADIFRDVEILKMAKQACNDIEGLKEFYSVKEYIKNKFNKKISEFPFY